MKRPKEKINFTPILVETNVIKIHPAIDFKGDKGYFGIWLPVKQDERERLFLVTSHRELIPADSLQGTNLKLNQIGIYMDRQWSVESLNNFLKSMNSVSPKEVFDEIKSLYEQYLEFSQPEIHDFMSLWVIGTYIFPIFQTYPYVYVGGVKQTGKSKTLYVTALIAFNSIFSTSVTTSALFRLIQNGRCSVFMDETEGLRNPERKLDFRAVLLQGYKSGGKVQRVGKDTKERHIVEHFEVYSPKMLANIFGLEDILEDRCIRIIMKRTLNRDIGNKEVNESNQVWQSIRDKLYVFAMDNWEEIKKIYEILPNETNLSSRGWELWHPLLAIASFLDKELYKTMTKLAEQKANENYIENITETGEYILIQSLVDLVQEKAGFISVKDIRSKMESFYDEEQKWLNNKWIGRAMGRLGFTEKRRVGTGIEYMLNASLVNDVASRLGIATAQSPQTSQTTLKSEVSEENAVNEDTSD